MLYPPSTFDSMATYKTSFGEQTDIEPHLLLDGRWYINGVRQSFELMQFTGRVDINNEDIWEGDICKDQYNRSVIIKWVDDLYWDGNGSSHPGFWFSHVNHINENEFDMDYHYSFNKLTRIGNIYENPELLIEKAK